MTSFQCARPERVSWGCTTDDWAQKSLSPLVLELRRAQISCAVRSNGNTLWTLFAVFIAAASRRLTARPQSLYNSIR
jgi:hypothetical protein